MKILDLSKTEEEAVDLLQKQGIHPTEKLCRNCHRMTLYFGSRIFWKCNTKYCMQQIGVRSGNWLSNPRLNLVTVVRFIYAWCWKTSPVKSCERELGIGNIAWLTGINT